MIPTTTTTPDPNAASFEQRRLINHLVQVVANYTGHDFDEIKLLAKARAISRGYPFDYDANGEVQPYSETQIDKAAASHLIEALHQMAAESGAVV